MSLLQWLSAQKSNYFCKKIVSKILSNEMELNIDLYIKYFNLLPIEQIKKYDIRSGQTIILLSGYKNASELLIVIANINKAIAIEDSFRSVSGLLVKRSSIRNTLGDFLTTDDGFYISPKTLMGEINNMLDIVVSFLSKATATEKQYIQLKLSNILREVCVVTEALRAATKR